MEHNSVEIQKVFIELVRNLGLDLGLDPDSTGFDSTSSIDDESTLSRGVPSLFRREYPLNSGDIPAVQDRFYALLKHRLQSEIQLQPPLFPWELTVAEYQDDVPVTEAVAIPGINVRSLWLTQLRRLALPIVLPDTILVQLINKCQELVTSPLREGAKLVQAVESLFPGDALTLNQLAGLVMMSPARSGYTSLQAKLGGDDSVRYEDAAPTQQMALSLLVAREMFGALTLNVSAATPTARYEWVTEAGVLTVQTDYECLDGVAMLRVEGTLPCASRFELRSAGRRSLAERPDAGPLSVALTDLDRVGNAPLEVQLEVQLGGTETLVFTIHLDA
jgi:hypothetical protein